MLCVRFPPCALFIYTQYTHTPGAYLDVIHRGSDAPYIDVLVHHPLCAGFPGSKAQHNSYIHVILLAVATGLCGIGTITDFAVPGDVLPDRKRRQQMQLLVTTRPDVIIERQDYIGLGRSHRGSFRGHNTTCMGTRLCLEQSLKLLILTLS